MLKEISIEIIRKCPNRCVHCSSVSSESCKEIIHMEKFKEIINEAKVLGLKTVCLSGGEPFLHPDIVKMVDYIHNQGLKCFIYSSGIYLNFKGEKESIPKEILRKISKSVTKIIFNIEAVEESIYDIIMGTQGCLPLLLQSIRNTIEEGIAVEGHFVPMKYNKNQIKPVVDLCERLGVSKISFLRLVVQGRALGNKDALLLSSEELDNVKKQLRELCESKSTYIRIGVPLIGETNTAHCEAAKGKLNIRYDGNVYPCEVFKDNRINILNNIQPDNIFRDNIKIIYKNSKLLNEVRNLAEKFSSENHCENCLGQYYMMRGY